MSEEIKNETLLEPEPEPEPEVVAEVEIEPIIEAQQVAESEPVFEAPVYEHETKESAPSNAVYVVMAILLVIIAVLSYVIPQYTDFGKSEPKPAATEAIANDMSAGVAATVNGVPLGEADVTAYIETVRAGMGLTDAKEWAAWLAGNGLDAASVRDQSIDYYVEMELLVQAAARQDVTVDEAAVESQLATIRAGFESEEAFNQALAEAGLTEDTLRRNIKLQLLQQGIEEKLTQMAPEAAKETAANDWLQSFMDSAVIEKTAMPEGLPYDVPVAAPSEDDADADDIKIG